MPLQRLGIGCLPADLCLPQSDANAPSHFLRELTQIFLAAANPAHRLGLDHVFEPSVKLCLIGHICKLSLPKIVSGRIDDAILTGLASQSAAQYRDSARVASVISDGPEFPFARTRTCEGLPIGAIIVAHQISRCRVPRKCLNDLLCQPLRRRVPGHRKPKELSSNMA